MEFWMMLMATVGAFHVSWLAWSVARVSEHLADLKSIIEEATVEEEED